MVCHFPSKAAAEAHLTGKGFKYDATLMLWINKAASVHARVMDSVRGWHAFFYQA